MEKMKYANWVKSGVEITHKFFSLCVDLRVKFD